MKTSTWLALIGGVSLFVIGIPLGAVLYVNAKHDAARARVLAALNAADPCAVHGIQTDVQSLNDEDLRVRYDARDSECSRVSAETDCTALAAGVDSGHLPQLGSNINAETKTLVGRMAARKITPDDLTHTKSGVDCASVLWPNLVAMFASTPGAWSSESAGWGSLSISNDLLTDIGNAGVKPEVGAALRQRAEHAAGVVATQPSEMTDAVTLCQQVESLHVDLGPKCKNLKSRAAADEKRAQAAQDQADRVAEQQAAADDRKESARFVACMARCNRSRSSEVVAHERKCREECAGDLSCIAGCHVASDCEVDCLAGGN